MKKKFTFIILLCLLNLEVFSQTSTFGQVGQPAIQPYKKLGGFSLGISEQKPFGDFSQYSFAESQRFKYKQEKPCEYYRSLVSGMIYFSPMQKGMQQGAFLVESQRKAALEKQEREKREAFYACEIWKSNNLPSKKAVGSKECCPEGSGICNVSEIPQSCNFMEDSLNHDTENKSLYSLLSNLSIKTSANNNEPLMGSEKFCEECYRDTFKLAFSKSDDGKTNLVKKWKAVNEFDKLEAELLNELAEQATAYVYRKSLHMQWKQKNLYRLHAERLEKVIGIKYGEDEKKAQEIRDKLQCKHINDLGEIQRECPQAHANLQSFLNSIVGDTSAVEIKDPYSPEAYNLLDEHMSKASDVLMTKWDASEHKFATDPKRNLNLELADINNEKAQTFQAIAGSLDFAIYTKKDLIIELCAQENFNHNDPLQMHKIWDIVVNTYDSHSYSGKVKNTSQSKILKSRELLEKQILVASLMNPEFALVSSTPKHICESVNSEDAGMKTFYYDERKWMNGIYKEMGQKPFDEIVPESDEEIFRKVLDLAEKTCENPSLKEEKQKALCGDIKQTNIPLKMDFSNSNLDEKKKVVLSKIQCSNKINIINTSKETKYNPAATPEGVVSAFAHENTMQDLMQELKTFADFATHIINTNASPWHEMVGEGSLNGITLSDGAREAFRDASVSVIKDDGNFNPDGTISYGNVVKEVMRTQEYRSYQTDVLQNPQFHSVSKSSVPKMDRPFQEQASNNSKTVKTASNKVSYNSQPSPQAANQVFENIQRSTSPISPSQVQQYVDRNKSNPATQKILDAIDGRNEQEKIQNLTDYLNDPSSPEPPIKSSAKRQELQGELDRLKQELASSKKVASNSELQKEVDAANKRLEDLTQKANFSMGRQSRSPASAEGSGSRGADLAGQQQQILNGLSRQQGIQSGLSSAGGSAGKLDQELNTALQGVAKNNSLILKDDSLILSDEITLKLSDLVTEKGALTQIVYMGKAYGIEQFQKKFNISKDKIENLKKFAIEGRKLEIAKDAKTILTHLAEDEAELAKRKDEIPTYVHLLCTMNPMDESCQIQK